METGTIVAVMPPDVPSPVGGLAHAGASLQLGCTQGRTPGAYGIVVSCNLAGYVGPHDVISSAQLVLTQSGLVGTDPLSSHWSSSLGNGPAQLISDMVRCSLMSRTCTFTGGNGFAGSSGVESPTRRGREWGGLRESVWFERKSVLGGAKGSFVCVVPYLRNCSMWRSTRDMVATL